MNAPTTNEILNAKQRLKKAMAELQEAQSIVNGHTGIDPLKVVFSDGVSAGHLKTHPAWLWERFVDHFGDIAGARQQFDAGLKSV
jgi:hypothetical protein